MIPFSLQVVFFRVLMFVLKISTLFLPIFGKPQIVSGPGSSLKLCEMIAANGVKKLLIVTDAMLVKLGLLEAMQKRLSELGVQWSVYDGVQPDPTIAQIETGLEMLRSEGSQAILAVGGGSSIDAAKVIAARATNNKPIAKMAGLFRVWRRILPLYAVPTTAGTGSEITIAAVVSDPAQHRKFAIMDPRLLPTAAALDGSLMKGLPPPITAATGMDALTHAVEAYISRNAMADTDREALDATRLIVQNLPKVMASGADEEARQNMSLASYKAGVAFTKAGVGYVHAIAHNFGARYHVPHGLANAIIMPYVLDFSKPACAQRLADLAKAGGLAKGGETPEQLADAFIAWIREKNQQFGIPTKVEKLKREDIPAIATAALKEAHYTYAVPRYMDQPDCERFIAQMLA
ncbi:iron-containing alcohol dehydrogenase [Sinimarinibacterium sp. CAU 1509]|uniref:iron-containing alcohol dehydrogenase n=1 Tax=Sinimarinibacterium sp. CAU 1509 TaxID=2562283 RepID=UPI0010AB648A|nr:iron-containing alcohol dehydrogenase [Sinimarinibacterium sp. CAU 1509]TJY59956.1 iron-containing alcohol dehydrogenase [Sinimarinibacterium sp. CAU 1509]